MICRKCSRSIIKYPCPHCGEEGGEAFIGKEGGTGGGGPSG